MSKLTTILLGEAIGASTFSICAAIITYFHAKNSPLRGGGFFNMESPEIYALIFSIFGAWAGMIIGGIISLQVINENSNSPKFAGAIGLGYGIVAFLVLYSCLKLYPDVPTIFVVGILVATVISSFACGVLTFYAVDYTKGLQLSIFNEFSILIILVLLPLISLIILPLPGKDFIKIILNPIENCGYPAILLIPPMLVLWGVLILINYTIYKTE